MLIIAFMLWPNTFIELPCQLIVFLRSAYIFSNWNLPGKSELSWIGSAVAVYKSSVHFSATNRS